MPEDGFLPDQGNDGFTEDAAAPATATAAPSRPAAPSADGFVEEKSSGQFEGIRDFFQTAAQKIQQAAAVQQHVMEGAAKAAQEFDADPRNWSSSRFRKEAPKPQNLQEQAMFDSILKDKKEKEAALLEELNPTKRPEYDEILPKIPASPPEMVVNTLKNMPLFGGQSIAQIQQTNRLMYDVFERPAGGLRALAKEAPIPQGARKTVDVFVRGFVNPENYPVGTFAESIQTAASSPDTPDFMKPLADPTIAGALGTIADAGYYFGVPEAMGRIVTSGKVSILKEAVETLNKKAAAAGKDMRVVIPEDVYQATAKNKDVFEVVDFYARAKGLKIEVEPVEPMKIKGPEEAAPAAAKTPAASPDGFVVDAPPPAASAPAAPESLVPQFKGTVEAVAHGKAIAGDAEKLIQIKNELAVLQPRIDEAMKTGDMQNGLNLATRKQFLNEAAAAATKPENFVPVRVNEAASLTPEKYQAKDVAPAEYQKVTAALVDAQKAVAEKGLSVFKNIGAEDSAIHSDPWGSKVEEAKSRLLGALARFSMNTYRTAKGYKNAMPADSALVDARVDELAKAVENFKNPPTFKPAEQDAIHSIISDIQDMEAKRRRVIVDPDLPVGEDTKVMTTGYVPAYLQNFGVTKAEDLPILEKAAGGQPLTEKQSQRVSELLNRWVEDAAARFGVSPDELMNPTPFSEKDKIEFSEKAKEARDEADQAERDFNAAVDQLSADERAKFDVSQGQEEADLFEAAKREVLADAGGRREPAKAGELGSPELRSEVKLPPHLQKIVDKMNGFSITDATPPGYGPGPAQAESRELLGQATAPAGALKAKAPQAESPLTELKQAASGERQPELFQKTPGGTAFAAPASRPQGAPRTAGTDEPWQPKVLPAEKIAKLPPSMGGMEYVRALEMPELVRLAKEISGGTPQIVKQTGDALGRFIGYPGTRGHIKLAARIFKDPELAAGVMAHELGHMTDWLPDGTLKRGNLIGRAISSTTKFMQTTFGENVDLAGSHGLNRREIRNTTFKFFLKEKSLKYSEWITDKTIRERYKAELAERTKKAIDKAVEEGGYLRASDLRKELEALTTWWHPFTPVKGSTYTAYRFSSKELYAEFLSVLMNAPAKALEIAPKFYGAFFEHLDKKPEFKQSFFQLQDMLLDPASVLKSREADIVNMMKKSRTEFENLLTQKAAAQKSLRFLLKYHFIDRNAAILEARDRAAAGRAINPEEDPKYLLEENSLIGSFVKSHLDDFEPIYQELRKSGLDFDKDYGQYIFLKRVMADRAEMANPLGHNPETAQRQLDAMKKRLGPEKFGQLEGFVGRARVWFKGINDLLKEDILTPQQIQTVEANNDYAPFRVTKYLKEYASAGFAHQVGTLNEIENPGASMVLKGVAMLRLYKRNLIEKNTMKFLQDSGDAEPAVVKTFDGGVHVAEKEGLDVVKWREGGKWHAAHVDPYIADSFKYDDSGALQTVGEVFNKILLNNEVFRPLYITYNLGFQSFNVIKDFTRSWKNTPGLSFGAALKNYAKAFPHALNRVREKFDPLIQQLEREGALNITMNDMIMGKESDDTEIDALMAKYGMRTAEKKVHPLLYPIKKLMDAIKFSGDVIETIPKVAGFYALEDMAPAERSYYIRNYVGTPNFKRKGKMFPVYNSVFMFSNIFKEGLRSDSEAAFRNPKTRSGFWWKTIKQSILPKILMILGAAGLFGKAVRDNYRKQTEYDKTNYLTIPIGEDERGKAIYGRAPLDETGRLISGLFWKTAAPLVGLATGQHVGGGEMKDLLAFGGGQLPSLSPTLNLMTTWGEYLTGGNPRDNFRNQNILTEDEAKAGGVRSIEPMVRWTINQSGLVHMDIRDRLKDETILEKTLALTPVINRFVRVGDYGEVEALKQTLEKEQAHEANARLDKKDLIRTSIEEGKTAGEASRAVPPQERGKFVKAFNAAKMKVTAAPAGRALSQATSNAQKLAVLEDLGADFDSVPEYRKALIEFYKAKQISLPVLNEAVRNYNKKRKDK